jgi:hypothetical protein
MAAGRFGAEDLIANLAQSLAQGTTDGMTVCSVNLVNRGNFPATVSIAITTTVNTIQLLDYIEKDIELLPGGVLERTGVAIKQGEYITVETPNERISAVAWGASDGDDVVVTSIPNASGFQEAVAGNLVGLGAGISVIGNAYNGGPALSFDGSNTAFYEKRFASPVNNSTNRFSMEAIFKPNSGMFQASSEDKGLIASVGHVSNSTGSELNTYAFQTFVNSSDYKTVSIRSGDGSGGGNWTSTGQNYQVVPDDWIYMKAWYNGSSWQKFAKNLTSGVVMSAAGGGITPVGADHVGLVVGKVMFGNAQLFANGGEVNFQGQIAMLRVTANGGINSDPTSSIPNYTSGDVTANDLVFFVKNS